MATALGNPCLIRSLPRRWRCGPIRCDLLVISWAKQQPRYRVAALNDAGTDLLKVSLDGGDGATQAGESRRKTCATGCGTAHRNSGALVRVNLKVGMVAGEASGDRLGAGLMKALARRRQVRFVGVGGEAMLAAGLVPLADMDRLAVNLFRDPVLKLPGLARLLALLRRQMLLEEVDLFIGVDFNVFNLLLEKRLKSAGVGTVHYVSPSVYAWRPGRVRRITQAADLLLALYPFEGAFYADTTLPVAFVGHPLADAIPLDGGSEANRASARQALGLPQERPAIALLPGSRMGEVHQHLGIMLDAAALVRQRLAKAQFLIPCPSPAIAAAVASAVQGRPGLPVQVLPGDARQALTACSGAIIKSGTATLEAMLLGRPMVITYRLGALNHRIARLLVRTEFVGLPNLLAGRPLVRELLQHQATPENLAAELLKALDKTTAAAETLQTFRLLHEELRKNADEQAAQAVLELLN